MKSSNHGFSIKTLAETKVPENRDLKQLKIIIIKMGPCVQPPCDNPLVCDPHL